MPISLLALHSSPCLDPGNGAYAQSTDTCTASILNRTTRVNPDGTFIIDNIPSNQGLGRIRIICPDVNSTRGGASDFIQILPGDDVNVGNIPLGLIPSSVKELVVTVTPTTLNGPGATAQLTVMATFSDGSTRDVTNGTTGTTYTSSNSAIGGQPEWSGHGRESKRDAHREHGERWCVRVEIDHEFPL